MYSSLFWSDLSSFSHTHSHTHTQNIHFLFFKQTFLLHKYIKSHLIIYDSLIKRHNSTHARLQRFFRIFRRVASPTDYFVRPYFHMHVCPMSTCPIWQFAPWRTFFYLVSAMSDCGWNDGWRIVPCWESSLKI